MHAELRPSRGRELRDKKEEEEDERILTAVFAEASSPVAFSFSFAACFLRMLFSCAEYTRKSWSVVLSLTG